MATLVVIVFSIYTEASATLAATGFSIYTDWYLQAIAINLIATLLSNSGMGQKANA